MFRRAATSRKDPAQAGEFSSTLLDKLFLEKSPGHRLGKESGRVMQFAAHPGK